MQLAIKTGDPKATRAVANANGRNNVCLCLRAHCQEAYVHLAVLTRLIMAQNDEFERCKYSCSQYHIPKINCGEN